MQRTTMNKNFANTYIYGKSPEYEKVLVDYVMTATRINKNDISFEDIKLQIKRRQVTNILYSILGNDNIVLMHSAKPMPKSFKVFCGKDIKTDNKLKIFIDCSTVLTNMNGVWATKSIDILIAYLVSAITNYVYYTEPTRLLMNSDIALYGMRSFSSLFTYIIDYLYKISLLEIKKDNCVYLSSLYYGYNILGKDINSPSILSMAKRISNISDRQINILEMDLDEDSFSNIKLFVDTIGRALKLDRLTIDIFVEKWIYLYGTGTHFGMEYFPSFASMLTDTYVGCYINNQKTIEKITNGDMVDFTRTIFRIGEAVMK